jgi:hypothetical protein
VNCSVPLGASVAVEGVTAIETSGLITIKVVVPTMLPDVAVMLVDPAATEVAKPAVLIVATDWVAESQLAAEVRTFVLPSLYVPVAANCCVVPAVMEGLDGVMAMETSVTVTGGVVPPELPPQPTNKLTPSNRNASSNRFIRTPPGRSRPRPNPTLN